MQVRLPKPVAARGAWRVAGRPAAGAVLLAVAVSACTGGGSSVPSTFTPIPLTSGQSSSTGQPGTRTPSPTGAQSTTRTATRAGTGTSSRSPTGAHSTAQTGTRAGTGAGSSSPAGTPTTSAPGASATRTLVPSAPVTTETRTVSPSAHASAAHTPAASATATPLYPTAAPATGGGGTAGLQDGLLFGVGGMAVLAGLGTLAYRRRLTRKFGTGEGTPREPADREPADR